MKRFLSWSTRPSRHRRTKRRSLIERLETRRLLASDVLYVGDGGTDSVQVFDSDTGAFVSTLVQSGASGLHGPRGMVVQGDNLLVVNQNTNTDFNGEVLRFNKDSGAALAPLVASNSASAPFAPRGIVVKDNVLYVADFFASPSRIAKYNATTGASLGSLIPNGFDAEFNPRGLVFGPDGKLYVTVYSAVDSDIFSEDAPGYVLRFNDTSSGAFEVITRNTADGVHQPGELHNPEGIVFDPSGESLYVTSFRPDRTDNGIVVIDVATKSQSEFIPLGGNNFAQSLLFGPENRLFVPIQGGADSGSIRSYDVTSESFNVLVAKSNGQLQEPWYMTFGRTNPSTLAYDTTPAVDVAPVLAGIESTLLDYAIGAAETIVSKTIAVSDADSTVLSGATIRIASNFQLGADVLSLGGPPVVQSSWNASTGTLTLSGTATLNQYRGALRCILYENTSANPSTGQRRVDFQVTGGTLTSNVQSRNIRIVPAADALTVLTNSTPAPANSRPVVPIAVSQVSPTNNTFNSQNRAEAESVGFVPQPVSADLASRSLERVEVESEPLGLTTHPRLPLSLGSQSAATIATGSSLDDFYSGLGAASDELENSIQLLAINTFDELS